MTARKYTREAWRVMMWAAVVLFSLAFVWWEINWEYLGDDIRFYSNYIRHAHEDFLTFLYRWVKSGFMVNGRTLEMVNFIWLGIFPRWLTAGITGVAVFSTIYFSLKLTFGRRLTRMAPVMLVILLCLVPWTRGLRVVVMINYIWGNGLILPFLYLVTRMEPRGWGWYLLAPIAFIGAGTHQALGLPLLVGLPVMLWVRRKEEFTRPGKVIIWAMILGGLFCLTSPGLLARAAEESENNNYSYLYTFLRGLIYLLPLLGRVLWLWWCRNGELGRLAKSEWIVWVVMTCASFSLAVVGKVLGMGRYYCCIFSVIAMFWRLKENGAWLKLRWAQVAACVTLILACGYVVYLQRVCTLMHPAMENLRAHPNDLEAIRRLMELPTMDLYVVQWLPLEYDGEILPNWEMWELAERLDSVSHAEKNR